MNESSDAPIWRPFLLVVDPSYEVKMNLKPSLAQSDQSVRQAVAGGRGQGECQHLAMTSVAAVASAQPTAYAVFYHKQIVECSAMLDPRSRGRKEIASRPFAQQKTRSHRIIFFIRFFILSIAIGAIPTTAQTQTVVPWPSRPITLVVPFTAAGPSDAIARLVARSMSAHLGQSINVENTAGDGGTKGAARVAAAAADGYTLLLHHAAHAASASLYTGLPYDPVRSFEPIGLVSDGPYVLVARTSLPFATAQHAIQYIRSGGGKVSFGHAGIGSGSHLVNLQLRAALGNPAFKEVSYRGTGPAMNDLAAGQIDFLMDQSVNVAPHAVKGTVRPLAVASMQRLPSMMNVPTFHEAGIKNFEASQWHALYAPKGTPKEAIARLSAALEAALGDPELNRKFANSDTLPFSRGKRGPVDARKKLEIEVVHWRKIIRGAGVQLKVTN